jgi:hypothetical protein
MRLSGFTFAEVIQRKAINLTGFLIDGIFGFIQRWPSAQA